MDGSMFRGLVEVLFFLGVVSGIVGVGLIYALYKFITWL